MAFKESDKREDFTRHVARGYIMSGGLLYRYHLEQKGRAAVGSTREKEGRDSQGLSRHADSWAFRAGAEIIADRIARSYLRIEMRQHNAEYVKACVGCQCYKASNFKPEVLLKTLIMKQRFKVLSIDLFGPLLVDEEGH